MHNRTCRWQARRKCSGTSVNGGKKGEGERTKLHERKDRRKGDKTEERLENERGRREGLRANKGKGVQVD